MMDDVPAQVWLTIVLIAAAWAPLHYVVRYVAASPARRDITAPPTDLAWRRQGPFLRQLIVLAGLAALAAFIWTPAAERFARSPIFLPLLLAGFAIFAGTTVINAIQGGTISPLVRGFSASFERVTQPRRFWASVGWNALLAVGLGSIALIGYRDVDQNTCTGGGESFSAEVRIAACTDVIDTARRNGETGGAFYAARGYELHRRGRIDEAFADYSRAIAVDPTDSYALYNRGLIHVGRNNRSAALADFDASLRVRDDNPDGHLHRGMLLADKRQYDRAIQDFDRAEDLGARVDVIAANRGLVRVYLRDMAGAERDFSAVPRTSDVYWVVENGRALGEMRAGRERAALTHLDAAIARNPRNGWALEKRWSIHQALGNTAAATRDETALSLLARPPQPPMSSQP